MCYFVRPSYINTIIFFLVLFCVLVSVAPTLASVDYCDPVYDCATNEHHFACNLTEDFSSKCDKAAQVEVDKVLILHKMNSWRSLVAIGNMEGYPHASNMLEMVR